MDARKRTQLTVVRAVLVLAFAILVAAVALMVAAPVLGRVLGVVAGGAFLGGLFVGQGLGVINLRAPLRTGWSRARAAIGGVFIIGMGAHLMAVGWESEDVLPRWLLPLLTMPVLLSALGADLSGTTTANRGAPAPPATVPDSDPTNPSSPRHVRQGLLGKG